MGERSDKTEKSTTAVMRQPGPPEREKMKSTEQWIFSVPLPIADFYCKVSHLPRERTHLTTHSFILLLTGLTNRFLLTIPPRWCRVCSLTSIQQFPHAQVADGEPHDGGLVQVCAHGVGQGQLVSQLIEHLRLLAPAAPGCIPRLLFPPFRANPVETRFWVNSGNPALWDVCL